MSGYRTFLPGTGSNPKAYPVRVERNTLAITTEMVTMTLLRKNRLNRPTVQALSKESNRNSAGGMSGPLMTSVSVLNALNTNPMMGRRMISRNNVRRM